MIQHLEVGLGTETGLLHGLTGSSDGYGEENAQRVMRCNFTKYPVSFGGQPSSLVRNRRGVG